MRNLLLILLLLAGASVMAGPNPVLQNGATTNKNIGFNVSPNPNTAPGPYSVGVSAQSGDNAHIQISQSSGEQFYDSAGTLQMTINPNGVFGNITAAQSVNSRQQPDFKQWNYMVLANQLGFNTNHLTDGIWPASSSVSIGGTNLFCPIGVFQPYMTNWWVLVSHAGGVDNVTVNTNYPFGSNTKTFNNWYDAIGQVTNVLNANNVIINSVFGVTTNVPFILAPTNNAPFQGCWNFICTNNGNNELDMPEGIIAFSGPWPNTSAWTNNYDGLITTPHMSTSQPEKHVSLVGAVGPSLVNFSISGALSEPNGILGTVFVPMVYGSNANLYAFLDTRDMGGGAVSYDNAVLLPVPLQAVAGNPLPAPAIAYSDATFCFDNINLLTPYDCNFAVLNLLGAFKRQLDGVDIQGDMVRISSDAIGGTNGWGILSAGAFNDNKQTAINVTIDQMYNGVSVGGNGLYVNLVLASGWNGIVTESAANSDQFYFVAEEPEKNYIQTWGPGNVIISGMQPQDTGPVWDSWPNLAIANNANYLLGNCQYVVENLPTYPTGGYPIPLPCSPTLGTSGLAFFHVNGNNGFQGGIPAPPFEFNPPIMESLQTFSNGVNVANGGLIAANPQSFWSLQLNSGNNNNNIITRLFSNGSEIGRLYQAGGSSVGNMPANSYGWTPNNLGLGTFAFWGQPDGQFGTFSNIIAGASFIGNGGGLTNVVGVQGINYTNLSTCTTGTNAIHYTVPAGMTNGYAITGFLTVSALSLDVIQPKIIWTDEKGTVQSVSLGSSISATGWNNLPYTFIRAKGGTAIDVTNALTTGTGSITYDVSAHLIPMDSNQ